MIVRALKESFEDEKSERESSLAALQRQAGVLRRRIDQAYQDKVDGEIEADDYRRMTAIWKPELKGIESQVVRLDKRQIDYCDAGVRFLEIAQGAAGILRDALPTDQKAILTSVMDKMTFDGERLEPCWRAPFGTMVELANLKPEDMCKGSKNPVWYSRRDSNPRSSP